MDAEVDAEREMGAMRADICRENERETSLFSWLTPITRKIDFLRFDVAVL
jgi:hypothetical protein